METRDATSQPDSTEPPNSEGSSTSSLSITQKKESAHCEIFNKTPYRIAIKSSSGDGSDQHDYLVISPFSTTVLSQHTIHNYECRRWQQEDLIDIEKIVAPTADRLKDQSLRTGCVTLLFIFLMVAILVPTFRRSEYTWFIFFAFVLVGLSLVVVQNGGFKKNLKRVWGAVPGVLRVINGALFLSVFFGLGVGLFYKFSGGKELLSGGKELLSGGKELLSGGKELLSGGKELATIHDFTMERLARIIQYLFLTIATLMPALMYFLFNRSQREKVQYNFIREVLRLDPGIRTITEAKSKYLNIFKETFGTTHTSAFLFTSGLPILLSTLMIYMGWLLVLQPFDKSTIIDVNHLENLLLPQNVNAVTFAFLGTYFFAVGLIYRGYVRADLTPKTYTNIIKRLLIAIILAWTMSALPMFAEGDAVTETVEFSTGLLYLLAFFIGIFPETGMTVLRDLSRNPLLTRWFPRLEEEHPITLLDGINLYDRSRFTEEGIENIENLAHHNLIGLILSTRISANRLVDMFDQAILYLHLGFKPDEIEKVRINLRKYGIRTATDLEAAYKSACELRKENKEECHKFLMMLEDDKNAQPTPLSRVQMILDTLRNDDWMTFLRNWRDLSQSTDKTFTLKGVKLVSLDKQAQEVNEKDF